MPTPLTTPRHLVIVSVLQRNRTNKMYGWRDIYYKELAHVIVEVWQIQNLQGGPSGWRPWEEWQFKSKISLLAGFPLALFYSGHQLIG